jgi:peptidyl-prolyl cis-trans isomerase D
MNENFDSKRIIYYVFIAAMAVLFALQWGPGSRGCNKAGKAEPQEVAATVNGKDIPLTRYARAYGNQLSRMRSQGVTKDLARQFGLPRQMLDSLVTYELVTQAAEARGIVASDEELQDELKKNPEFQKDGVFDFDRYQEMLSYERKSAVDYESDLRKDLSYRKMLALVDATATVSDEEVKSRYLKEGNRAKISFVRFNPTLFASKVEKAKPGEVDAWAKDHDKAIQDFYTANQLSYHEPEKIRMHQIFFSSNANDSADKRAAVKARLDDVRKQVQGGKDLSELAKQLSDDGETKDKGGDTGFVDRIALAPSLAAAVFTAKPGDLTDVIDTPIGFYLAKVDEKKAAETKALESVKGEIAAQLWTKEKAKAIAKTEAEKALSNAKAGKSLKELYPPEESAMPQEFRFSAQTKPEATSTGEFNSTQLSIPQLGTAPMASKAIFEVKGAQLLDQVFEVGDGYAVIFVDERKEPSDADFDASKANLRAEAEKAKAIELHEAFMKALRQTAVIVTNERAIDEVAGG